MTAKLDTRDLPDRLEYRVTQRHTRIHLIFRTFAWLFALCVPIGMAKESPFFAIVFMGFFFYGAFTDITGARRGTDVTFIINERDIISDGYTQHEYYPVNRWRIKAPDLSWREMRSYEDGPVYPHGVYCGNDCVLPLVTMEEGHRIVEAIYSRFPDTASDSDYDNSSVPSPITTLGLSRNRG